MISRMAINRHCIFCGPTTRKITGEHVFPQWMSELFRGAGSTKYRVRRAIGTHRALVSEKTRGANMLDIKVNAVCKKCNNEDLCDLEDIFAKPILVPLILGMKRRLTDEQQMILAAWITKTAMVNEFTDSRQKFFSQTERETFLSKMEPLQHSCIWLARCQTKHVVASFQHTLFLKKRPSDGLKIFVLTMVLGRLVFQLLVRRDGNFRQAQFFKTLDRWDSATARIFPNPQTMAFAPRQYIGDHALKPFADRWGGVTRSSSSFACGNFRHRYAPIQLPPPP
jgi:hypothetical protein